MTFIDDFEDNVSKNFMYVWEGGDDQFIEESTVYVDTHSILC